MINTVQAIHITAAGGTFTIDQNNPPDIVAVYATSGFSLLGNVAIDLGGLPTAGTTVLIQLTGLSGVDLNSNTFTVFGQTYDPQVDFQHNVQISLTYSVSGVAGVILYQPTLNLGDVLQGGSLIDYSTVLTKLAKGTSAQIIVCDAGGIATYVTMSGDGTLSNAGVFSIAAGVIVNADINAAAAIARTKIANGTAAHVVINDGSGTLSSEAALSTVRGGLGTDASAATGFLTMASGVATFGAISQTIQLQVSFETGYVGDFKIKMPFAGTVTEIYAYAIKAIAGTDNGTIVAKNNAGTTMTAGTITYTASDARGTAYTVTPSASNTFIATDILTFTTAKTTAGGVVQLSIKVTRSAP